MAHSATATPVLPNKSAIPPAPYHYHHQEKEADHTDSAEPIHRTCPGWLLTAKQLMNCGYCHQLLISNPNDDSSSFKKQTFVMHQATRTICHRVCYREYYKGLMKRAELIVSDGFARHLHSSHTDSLKAMARDFAPDMDRLPLFRLWFYTFSQPALPYVIHLKEKDSDKLQKHVATLATSLLDQRARHSFSIPRNWWCQGYFVMRVEWDKRTLTCTEVTRLLKPIIQNHRELWSQHDTVLELYKKNNDQKTDHKSNPTAVAMKPASASSASTSVSVSRIRRKHTRVSVHPELLISPTNEHVYIYVSVAHADETTAERYTWSLTNLWKTRMLKISTQLQKAVQELNDTKLITGQRIEVVLECMHSRCEWRPPNLCVGIQFAPLLLPPPSSDKEKENKPKQESIWFVSHPTDKSSKPLYHVCHEPATFAYPYDGHVSLIERSFPKQFVTCFNLTD